MPNSRPLKPVLNDLRQGKMVLLQDDPSREDEGDLVMAAEHAKPEDVNFMAKHARGLMCVPMTADRADSLNLRRMVPEDRDRIEKPGFTVSVDARDGTTTGISARDRAETIRVLVDENSKPQDLRRPGHVFPLIARDEGVFVRRGQTEGSVDLLKLAGLKPVAVICEVMNEDGTMACDEDFRMFCEQHDIKRCRISDIVRHRTRNESILTEMNRKELSTRFGTFELRTYTSSLDNCLYMVVVADTDERSFSENGRYPRVLMHKKCIEGHVFLSDGCDCRKVVNGMLEKLSDCERGALICWSKRQREVPADPHSPFERFSDDSGGREDRSCIRDEQFNDRYVGWNTAKLLQELDMNPATLVTDRESYPDHVKEMGGRIENTIQVERILSEDALDKSDVRHLELD